MNNVQYRDDTSADTSSFMNLGELGQGCMKGCKGNCSCSLGQRTQFDQAMFATFVMGKPAGPFMTSQTIEKYEHGHSARRSGGHGTPYRHYA